MQLDPQRQADVSLALQALALAGVRGPDATGVLLRLAKLRGWPVRLARWAASTGAYIAGTGTVLHHDRDFQRLLAWCEQHGLKMEAEARP